MDSTCTRICSSNRSDQMAPKFFVFFIFALCAFDNSAFADLQYNYYAKTCPDLENLVRNESYRLYKIHGNYATSSYRNIFHDCAAGHYAKKCDGSILLQAAGSELDSAKNAGLRNLKWVDVLKKKVEAACPGVVSCADLIVLTGRDSIAILGQGAFDYFPVKTGRKDSRVSLKAEADVQLPGKDDSVDSVLAKFAQLGIDVEHTVALLGGHSVGRAHCESIENRLYPIVDPTLNPVKALYLKGRCPANFREYSKPKYARFDEITPMGLDNNYYKNTINGETLLNIDQRLYADPRTKPYVLKFAADNAYFAKKFTEAIQILTEYNAFTGPEGEIRKDCRFPN